MSKTITLDYEEFEALKEKADLNESKIRKRVNEQTKICQRMLKQQYELYKDREIRDRLIRSIKSGIKQRINCFGYVKYEDIAELLAVYE